jgi:hypothetical protein
LKKKWLKIGVYTEKSEGSCFSPLPTWYLKKMSVLKDAAAVCVQQSAAICGAYALLFSSKFSKIMESL